MAAVRSSRVGDRVVIQGTRLILWCAAVAFVVAGLFGAGGLLVVFGLICLGLAALYERPLRDWARSTTLAPTGTVQIGVDGLVFSHPGVLATDAHVPWSHVRSVSIDTGPEPGVENWRTPRVRFRLDLPPGFLPRGYQASDLFSTRTGEGKNRPIVHLLSSTPVVPNVFISLAPSVSFPWHFPYRASHFNPPRGRSWPVAPGQTPGLESALFLSLADPIAFGDAIRPRAAVRQPNWDDYLYIEANAAG